MLASFAVSVMAVWQLAGLPVEQRAIEQTLYTWIASGDFVLDLTLRVDPLSAVMILVITGIGSLIHIYSTAYMHDEVDSEYARYFSYLNLFAAFMLVLVLGANFLVLFVGWEGVGLCSYLLIGFWFRKKSAADAGKKAFVVNRIGDYAFILGMLLLFARFGTLDFQQLAATVAAMPPETGVFGVLSIATLLLFIGATGKSAQIPLYVWLPDAMEGPTPVSALIHAATMVTAGVYMIGRNAVLFSHAPETHADRRGHRRADGADGRRPSGWCRTTSSACSRTRRSRSSATCSWRWAMGAFGAGIFHLYTHAFFKALLFLGSGAVIHALHGEQDIRNMGGLKRYLPITYWTFLIGSLAIAGVPFLSGFFSKDEILFETFAAGHWILWMIGAVTSLLTATYMFRLVFLTFHGERRHDAPSHARTPHRRTVAPTSHAVAPRIVAPARCAAGDGAGADRPGARVRAGRLRRRAARRSAVRTAWRRGWRRRSSRRRRPPWRSSRPNPRRQARKRSTRRSKLTLMAVSSAIALARHRPRRVHLAEAPRDRRRDGAQLRRAPPAAAEQVLRRRDLRRGRRPADSGRLAGRAVARARRAGRRRRGQRDRRARGGRVDRAAPPADRIGARLRRLDVRRRRRDPRLLPMAIELSTPIRSNAHSAWALGVGVGVACC